MITFRKVHLLTCKTPIIEGKRESLIKKKTGNIKR